MLILDTLAWIWLVNGSADLGEAAQSAIDQAAEDGRLYVPAVAIWELAIWEKSGRLVLSMPCHTWVASAVRAPGLAVAPLTPEIAVEGANLPGAFHRDPIDRIIVATARIMDGSVVTPDRQIQNYGALGHVGLVPA